MHFVFDESAEQTSDRIDEIANILEKSNLLSDSEDEFENHRNITSISHQPTTPSDDVLNDADRTADSPAVHQTSIPQTSNIQHTSFTKQTSDHQSVVQQTSAQQTSE